jgi:hypothetical protein
VCCVSEPCSSGPCCAVVWLVLFDQTMPLRGGDPGRSMTAASYCSWIGMRRPASSSVGGRLSVAGGAALRKQRRRKQTPLARSQPAKTAAECARAATCAERWESTSRRFGPRRLQGVASSGICQSGRREFASSVHGSGAVYAHKAQPRVRGAGTGRHGRKVHASNGQPAGRRTRSRPSNSCPERRRSVRLPTGATRLYAHKSWASLLREGRLAQRLRGNIAGMPCRQ